MTELVGAAVAAGIALVAWRAGALSRSGALAATVVGALAMSRGAAWGWYLVVWFVAASALSRLGRDRKAARTAGVVAKGGTRDAWQVLANGGVYAVAAAGAFRAPDLAPWPVVAAASLAAAAADTWATEIGTLARGTAWSLRTARAVPAGTSGAITLPGTLAMLIGAGTHALLASVLLLVPPIDVAAVALGGVAGASADTLLGAWTQGRRRCPACGVATERPVHDCGTATERAGGLPWLDNDAVNLACTVIGGLTAWGVTR